MKAQVLVPTILVAAAAATPAAALAQQADTIAATQIPTDKLEQPNRGVDGDIVVTARRSAESIQSVPVSVTAFNAETLREASIKDVQDLQFSVPGIYLTGGSTKDNAAYSIRGQGRAVAGSGQPAVIAYFSEVPLLTLGSGGLAYDLASVQVLKGPQGTLFGRNTTGGAVLFSPQSPTDAFEGYARATYGNYDFRDLEAAINIPIANDRAALRIAGRLSRRDGYTRDISGGRLDDIDSNQVRGSLKLAPIEGITNLTTVDYRSTNQAGNAPILVAISPSASLIPFGPGLTLADVLAPDLAAQQARGPRKVDYGGFKTRNDIRQLTLVNRTEAEISDDVSLVNIFGYQRLTFRYRMNTDALPEPIGLLDVAANDFRVKQITDEVQLKGKLADGKLDWLVGGFYYRNAPTGVNGGDFDQAFGLLPGQYNYQYLTENSRALFANIAYKLDGIAPGLKFNAGFRYTWDRYAACGGVGEFSPPYTVGPEECDASNPIFSPGTGANLKTQSSAPTWTVGLDWQVNRDLFLYATSRRGYRGGGINFPALGPGLAAQQFFRPEKLTDVELGVRSDWRIGGMRGRFNVSGYISKVKNVQSALSGVATRTGCIVGDPVFGQPPISPDGDCMVGNDPASTILLVNIGDTKVSGVEAELTLWPAEGLRLGVAGSLLHQSTDKFSLTPNVAFYADALDGKIPLNYTPKASGTAELRYELPLDPSIGRFVFNANLFVTGPVNMIAYRAKGYALTDLRLDWNEVAGSTVDLGLFVKNLFDKDAVTSGGLNAAGAPLISVIYNEPRMFGVEARFRFGS